MRRHSIYYPLDFFLDMEVDLTRSRYLPHRLLTLLSALPFSMLLLCTPLVPFMLRIFGSDIHIYTTFVSGLICNVLPVSCTSCVFRLPFL
jgi:hypothetical protein